MDNYGTMNNSYGNIVYSGQASEITQLQNQTVQYQYQQQEQHQYFDGLKETQYQGRETIIANNVTAQPPGLAVGQVAYQTGQPGYSVAMEQPEPVAEANHEGQVEALEQNHQPEEPAVAVAEEPGVETNGQQEEHLEEEHLEEEKEVAEEVKDEADKAEGEEDKKEGAEGEAATEDNKEEVKEEGKEEVKEEGGKSKVINRKDGTPADLEICRVCQSKEELGDIFEFETSVRICDLIMKLCTNVRIAERDHLPHKICKSCVEKVRIAYEFKTTCENTDKELRQTLKRSYKSRRTTDFVIVNCPMSDEDKSDEEPQDDDEYKVSQSEVESEPVTSDDSFAPSPKKKKTPGRKRRGGRRARAEPAAAPEPPVKRRRGRQPGFSPKAAAAAKAKASKPSPKAAAIEDTPRRRGRPPKSSRSPGLANVVYIEAPDPSSSDSEDDKPIKPRKPTKTHDCNKCDETFKTGVELKEHLLTHKGDLFPCTKCEKTFKSKIYLGNHLERHTQDEKKREEKLKAKEAKKQQQRLKEIQKRKEHEERLKRQKEKNQSGGSAEKKKKPEPSPVGTGRDLFKCVAPVTSTYWSDSFSD